ncbi:N-acetylmuramoyl-L-alanine amidase [Geodermatophilus sp. SYSU D00697]
MRRLLTGSLAFVAFTGTVLVLPVYASPGPEAEPVATSTEEVELGSVEDPAPQADVQEGTSEPVAGVADTAPTLTVTRTDVPEFSLVGVTWRYDPAVTDTVVKVRVQDGAGAWGEWTEVGMEDAEQDPGADADADVRGGTAPLWTGPSTGVEAELVTRSGAAPTDVQLDLVDPGESAADGSLRSPDIQATADAAMAMPAVYSRAQWGADESIMGWDPEYAPTIKAATLHHTADSNNYTADQVPAIMRSIYRYHSVSRGWGDIGYNVIVDKFGRLWEGRYGGLSRPVVGAHAGGFNTGTFGVSMLGTYESVTVPQATVDAVAAVIGWKFSLHGVDPRGTTVLTSGGGGTARYSAGTRVTLPTIFGHRDVGSTSCPGTQGYARLGEIRNQVASRLSANWKPIADRYASDPGLRQMLGSPVGSEQSYGSVRWQVYQYGRLYYSPVGGVRLVRGAILDTYLAAGGPAVLGPPISDDAPAAGGAGAFVSFEHGDVYWSPSTGTQIVRGSILTTWLAWGGAGGALGFPTTSDAKTPEGKGYFVRFQRGGVYYSQATGTQVVLGGIHDTWLAAGGTRSSLGFPTTSDTPAAGGAYVRFQGGDVYWSPSTGIRVVRNGILAAYRASGGPTGPLGYPTTSHIATPDKRGTYVRFQNGGVYWSAATGARAVVGSIHDTWLGTGGLAGPLGYPTTSDTPAPGGAYVRFQGGDVYWSPSTGTRVVRNGILAAYRASGGPTGPLGYPTTSNTATADKGGSYVRFEHGGVYWSAATGTRVVLGSIHDTWLATGGPTGPLGYPTTGDTPAAGGAYVRFQGGDVYWSPSTGTRVVRNGILATYRASGGPAGPLGYPTTSNTATADGRGSYVRFRGGDIWWSAGTGTRIVREPAAAAYREMGGSSSRLGFPTRSTYAVGALQRTDFQHGSMTVDPATGAVTTSP